MRLLALKTVLRIAVIFTLAHVSVARADAYFVNDELVSVKKLIATGHVKPGLDRLVALFRKTDPKADAADYLRIGTLLVEYLSEFEYYSQALQFSAQIASTEIPKSQLYARQWMQFYVGRALAYSGKADEGEKLLRGVTLNDARLVDLPAQRAAAITLARIAFDRGNISQAAIWIRRAVIGTLVDKGAASEEILDVLTEYAYYLANSRQLPDSYILFAKLLPLYEENYSHQSPKYLRFQSLFLEMLADIGNIPAADHVYENLNDNVNLVDIVAPSVRGRLYFQGLFKAARKNDTAAARASTIQRLKEVVTKYPDFSKQPRNHIIFAFYALLANDLQLAERLISKISIEQALDPQFAAYKTILKSFIAARQNKFGESIALSADALIKIRKFNHRFENQTASRLPATTVEERLVLSLIVALNAPHVSTYDQANTLFELEQFVNGDKAKLGLSERAAREHLNSDLQREELRTRDRLKDLRDRIMRHATNSLLARVRPIRGYSVSKSNDYGYLIRLEDIEDKLANADDNLRVNTEPLLDESADRPIGLREVQGLIQPNEALIMHVMTANGIVTTCIDSNNWTFNTSTYDKHQIQQLIIDTKLLSAAVRDTNEPSAILDANFPAENAYRIYKSLFGAVEPCIKTKSKLLLATDPDFFSLPWNALLTTPPQKDFVLRDAAWLPRSFALSLLPSARSLFQLRTILKLSHAKKKFLGIGDPDFQGKGNPTKVALSPLFISRGVANKAAIRDLPRLPESARELRVEASALSVSAKDLLLGADATERGLRKHPLDNYKVISFATHAVVAGEIEGLTEPAIVVTPGSDDASDQNDGLLTTTEISTFTLDANLIILSACNTAASDGRASGRGLSGLANAFFLAGARSVAVTQWTVLSSVAEKIGAGLISRSTKIGGVGVSEALREAMMDYVSNVKKDYLANPRFWGAYIIAGDGNVRPLDEAPTKEIDSGAIKLEWERVTQHRDDEIQGITEKPHNRLFYSIGLERPRPNEKVAGSYLAEITAAGSVRILGRDPDLPPSGIVSVGNERGVLGFIPKGTKSSAIFRLLNEDGHLRWQHVEQSSTWNFPVSMIRDAKGYTLISIERPSSGRSSLIFTLVSNQGETLNQRRIPLSITAASFSARNVAVDGDSKLTIAIGGSIPRLWSPQYPAIWTNKQTGSKRYCTSAPEDAEILRLDGQTFAINARTLIHNFNITSVKSVNSHLFVAGSFTMNCRLEKQVRFAELTSSLQVRTIFESRNVNSIEVRDFAIMPNNAVVLAGTTRTFLPTAASAAAVMTPEQLKNAAHSPWDEAFWEKGEQRSVAFVLAINTEGAFLGDRIFSDLRGRSISAITVVASNGIIVVGNAFGERGWLAGLRLDFHRPKSESMPH